MSDMDVDDGFDDINFESDDFMLIQQTEELYLSQQSHPTIPTSTQREGAYEFSVNWEEPARDRQETTNIETLDTLDSPQNIHEPTEGTTAAPNYFEGFPPEAISMIEELKFELERVSISKQNEDPETVRLKSDLEHKSRDIIQLKKELAKYKAEGSQQQKRSYPGQNIFNKPNAQLKRAMSIPKSSPLDRHAASFSTPSSSQRDSMPLLSSLASSGVKMEKEVSPAPTQPKKLKTAVIPKPVAPSPPPPVQPSLIPPIPAKPLVLKARLKPSDAETNNQLFIILLTPLFKKWNRENHEGKKDINTALTQPLIRKLSEEFSQQFVPEQAEETTEHERLRLLASDINSYLVKSESATATIRVLLNILNLSLRICIKDKLYQILSNIAHVTHTLAACFPIAQKYLYTDSNFDSNSLLLQFVKSFAMFPFREPRCTQFLADHPKVEYMKFEELQRKAALYKVSPTQIYKDLQTPKTTKRDVLTVKTILELFVRVGDQYNGRAFDILLTDIHFLNLLNPKRPYPIVLLALNVLQRNIGNKDYMSTYEDQSLQLIHCLTDLAAVPQNSLHVDEWHTLQITTMEVLRQIVMADIQKDIAIGICKAVLVKTKDVMDFMATRFTKADAAETRKSRALSKQFVKMGLETMYRAILLCPEDIFNCVDQLTATSVLELVNYMSTILSDDPPLKLVIDRFKDSLEQYIAKSNR